MITSRPARGVVSAVALALGSLCFVPESPAQLPQTQLAWVNVTAYGADPENNATDDTVPIQNAINAAWAQVREMAPPAVGTGIHTLPVVYFPRGHYKLTSRLKLPHTISLISDEKAILQQTASARILSFDPAEPSPPPPPFPPGVGGYMVWIRGLKFVGGTNQIYFGNHNLNSAMLHITESEFHKSTDYAIYTRATNTEPDLHLSTNLTVNKSKFMYVNKVLYNTCDNALIKDSWVQLTKDTFTANSAAFYNYGYTQASPSKLGQGGVLRFDNMFGVPEMGSGGTRHPGVRWVDLHGGSFYAHNSRFGGEDGGMPIVYSFVDTRNQAYPFLGNVISIEESTVAAGPSSVPNQDSGAVYLVSGVPQLVRIVGNEGIVDEPYVKASPSLNLSTYFASVSNAQQKYKIEIEPNMTSAAPSAPRVPVELWRFLRSAKHSPFPIGAQRAIDASGVATYTYTIPSDVKTFTGILTVSGNPLVAGNLDYRSSLSYMISMVMGYNYSPPPQGPHDYLVISPLLQAHGPNLSGTLSATVYFNSTGTTQQSHGIGSDFTVRVQSNQALGQGQTFVSLEVLNIGY